MCRIAPLLICALLLISHTKTLSAASQGEKAPDCELISLDRSQTVSINQFKGQVIYLDFWASWCRPCAKSFPFMIEMAQDLETKGLKVIGVNMDEDISEAQSFIDKFPVNFVNATAADHNCAKRFDVKAMPSSYLIDREGIIEQVHLGFRPGQAKELRAQVEKLLIK